MAEERVTLEAPGTAVTAAQVVETTAPDLTASLVAELTPPVVETAPGEAPPIPKTPPQGPDGRFVSPYNEEEVRKLESVRDEIRAAAAERRQEREAAYQANVKLEQTQQRLEEMRRVMSQPAPSPAPAAVQTAEPGPAPVLSWEDAQDERRMAQWQQDYAAWIEARSERRNADRVLQLVEEQVAPVRQALLQTEQQRQLTALHQHLASRLAAHPEADQDYVIRHVDARHAQEPSRPLDQLIDQLVEESVDHRRDQYPRLLEHADPVFLAPALKSYLQGTKDPALRRMLIEVAQQWATTPKPGGSLAPVEAGATPPPFTPPPRQTIDGQALVEELNRLAQADARTGLGRVA